MFAGALPSPGSRTFIRLHRIWANIIMHATVASIESQPTDAGNDEPIISFSRPTTHRALIRGSLFAPVPQFVKETFGEARWPEFLELVDPVAARYLNTELQALSWYPFKVITSAVEAIQMMTRATDAEATLRKLSRHNLDRATNIIFRAIFKVGSPEFMVSKSDQVWEKYYSKGRMLVGNATRGCATVQLVNFREITPTYTRVVQYAMEAVITKAGGKLTRSEITLDTNRGDHLCEFSYTWKM